MLSEDAIRCVMLLWKAACTVELSLKPPADVTASMLQGADGTYGTSLTYGTAMDPSCDVMIAYKQNDRLLQPDHGFPVRVIIPGHIGGSPSGFKGL